MAPVSQHDQKQAPNWRVATMRRSMTGFLRVNSQGIMSDERQRADERNGDDEGGAEPVVLQAAIEHDLERAEEGRDQQEADEIEAQPFLA